MKNTTTLRDHGAPSTSSATLDKNIYQHAVVTANTSSYLLPAVAQYLIESAYGEYRETVSRQVQETSKMLALAVFASHIQPTGLMLYASRTDLPMSHMIYTAHLLDNQGYVAVGVGAVSKAMPLRSNDMDIATWRLLDSTITPSRARADAGYMRAAIHRAASRYAPCSDVYELLREVAADTGSEWPTVATRLAGGDGVD